MKGGGERGGGPSIPDLNGIGILCRGGRYLPRRLPRSAGGVYVW
jgi:hypothetical protein